MDNVLYYESHVTVRPVAVSEIEMFGRICNQQGFKVAEFLMVKDGPIPDMFCSARDSDGEALTQAMKLLVSRLRTIGFIVVRYKIEAATIDSKYEDIFNLLDPKYRRTK